MDIDQEYEMMLMDVLKMDWQSQKNEPKTHGSMTNINIEMKIRTGKYKTWHWNKITQIIFGLYSFKISSWSICLVIGLIEFKRF